MEVDVDLETTGEKVAIGSAGLTVLAAFLPWVNLGIASASGIDTDGVLTLLFGLAAIGVVVLREWEQVERIAVGVLGGLTVLIAVMMYGNLSSVGGESSLVSVGAGIGLHLTVVGGLGMLAAAVVDRVL